ncbi:aspartyl protease family protein [Aliiglaciecola sp. 3_MG-2023]|uniref:aspartyl protease family protein n=1 Tax=Aliiglaciecola sp. 3_MG-2023 TaxID=3062644 RepID=UPI0026E3B0FB|nr:aspartyl protease family protein [Aliiglaciecola sp. 3_MG-2023]MDO6695426.1 aspartyl protease family protein [Aliiglaciecola sp. 3_MG-2023]
MKYHINIIILLVVFGLLLSGCSLVNSLRMMHANDDIEPNWPSPKNDQVLPAIYIGEKPYVRLLVNDSTELLFLIDTGASFSMVFDTPKGKSLLTKKGFELKIAGWGEGQDTQAYQSELASLHIGEVEFENVKVAYIPISLSPYYLREDEAIFDGVLGHDILRHFAWTLDKQKALITASAEPQTVHKGDDAMPISVSFSKLSIDATVEFNQSTKLQREVLIDTGSRHYFKMSAAFPIENDIALPTKKIMAADFGMSGMTEHQRVTIPAIHFQSLQINGVKTNLIPSDDEDDWWVIGSALMNQFITVIDYHNHQFIMRAYPQHVFASRYNLAGVELRKLQNGNFVVRYVTAGLPAEVSGLQAGDEIISINQIPAIQISEQQWIELNATPGSRQMCVRNRDCISYVSQHILGYSSHM